MKMLSVTDRSALLYCFMTLTHALSARLWQVCIFNDTWPVWKEQCLEINYNLTTVSSIGCCHVAFQPSYDVPFSLKPCSCMYKAFSWMDKLISDKELFNVPASRKKP
jgi:hypothetical protein